MRKIQTQIRMSKQEREELKKEAKRRQVSLSLIINEYVRAGRYHVANCSGMRTLSGGNDISTYNIKFGGKPKTLKPKA